MTKAKELIEGLIEDYTNGIEKGQEHINCLDIENRLLDQKKKEIDEMITFNKHEINGIMSELEHKREKLRYYQEQLKEDEEA